MHNCMCACTYVYVPQCKSITRGIASINSYNVSPVTEISVGYNDAEFTESLQYFVQHNLTRWLNITWLIYILLIVT